MKESTENFLKAKDLVESGVYRTHTNEIVQIRGINKEKNELHVYNITESCNVYMNLEKHYLVKKIR